MRQGGLILAVSRVRSKKKIEKNKNKLKSTPPKTHHDIRSSPATATISRRSATRHIPRVSPYTPASIDPGFVEITLVQLSQLSMEKTASVASFPRPVFLQQMVQKKEKKNNPSPPPAIVTATPTGHPTPLKLRGRVGKSWCLGEVMPTKIALGRESRMKDLDF